MTVSAWPSGLPDELLQSGYSQSSPDTTLKTEMEVGPAKIRRRSTAQTYPVKGTMKLTEAQLGTLRTFYETTLLGGSLRFSHKDPVSLTAKEFRFTAPPSWTMSNGFYVVQLEFEVLP